LLALQFNTRQKQINATSVTVLISIFYIICKISTYFRKQ